MGRNVRHRRKRGEVHSCRMRFSVIDAVVSIATMSGLLEVLEGQMRTKRHLPFLQRLAPEACRHLKSQASVGTKA